MEMKGIEPSALELQTQVSTGELHPRMVRERGFKPLRMTWKATRLPDYLTPANGGYYRNRTDYDPTTFRA